MDAEVLQWLFYFGIAICIVTPLMIIVPFVRGDIDLLTYRNVVLAGCFPFIGLSSIGLATGEKPYGYYDMEDFFTFAGMASTFIMVFAISYNLHRPSQAVVLMFTGRRIEVSNLVGGVLAIIAISLSLLDYLMKRLQYLPVLTELLSALAPSFMAFAALFAIGGWMKNKSNVLSLAIMIGIFSFSLVYSIVGGSGRRVLLSVLASLPIYFYWTSKNRFSASTRWQLLNRVCLILVPLALVVTAYSNVRHYERRENEDAKIVYNRAIDALQRIPDEVIEILSGNKLDTISIQIGQDATNCSMLMSSESRKAGSSDVYSSFRIPTPFHTILFVLSNPIPRSFWEGKPLGLGYMIPVEVLHVSGISLGAGIVGHCIHEGGIFFIFFYAILFSYLAKVIDVALTQDPSNLFLLGFATATFPNLVMLVRGDQGLILVICIFSYICYVVSRRIAATLRSFG
jgi:hypothetical protein